MIGKFEFRNAFGRGMSYSRESCGFFQEPNAHEESGAGGEGEANGGDKRGVSSSLSSLIKVSPLKSLLREDLRRRISARGRARGSNVRNYIYLRISNLKITSPSQNKTFTSIL